MLALADPPAVRPDLIPGLKYSPPWHREQEDKERDWLDAYVRWTLKFRTRPVQD